MGGTYLSAKLVGNGKKVLLTQSWLLLCLSEESGGGRDGIDNSEAECREQIDGGVVGWRGWMNEGEGGRNMGRVVEMEIDEMQPALRCHGESIQHDVIL